MNDTTFVKDDCAHCEQETLFKWIPALRSYACVNCGGQAVDPDWKEEIECLK